MFEIYVSPSDNHFYFRLKARNGQIILTSQGYKSRKACETGIASVQKNAGDEGRFEVKTARNGKLFFNLLAANKQVIGTSQMYGSPAAVKKGMASVMTNAAGSTVKDLTAAQ